MRKIKLFKKNKKNKLSYSLGGSTFLVIVTIFVTYIYFKDPAVLTFSSNRSLPIYSVDTEEKKVAITFDVNWGKDRTIEILDVLDKHDAKATFFLIGKWIDYNEQNVELVKEMDKRGHEIGNHSNLHPDFPKLSKEKIIKELEITDSKIYEITGKRNKIFRFPKGEYDQKSIEIVKELGYTPIQWDVDSIDWKEDGLEKEYERVASKLKEGSIVLFHNNTEYTPQNLDKLLKEFKEQGYEFVSVSDLIYKEDYEIDVLGVQKKRKYN